MAGLGDVATFSCNPISGTPTNFLWLVNGTAFCEQSQQREGVACGIDPIGGTGTLQIRNVSVDLNNTLVQCKVNTTDGGQVSSRISTLLVQGMR